ncbi:unnamed protein product, partial [Prorocentrum cordatum]
RGAAACGRRGPRAAWRGGGPARRRPPCFRGRWPAGPVPSRERAPRRPSSSGEAVMKLFCNTPLCFELQASSRFQDPKLRDLMAFLRKPGKQVPPAIRATWNAMQLKPDDRRLRE